MALIYLDYILECATHGTNIFGLHIGTCHPWHQYISTTYWNMAPMALYSGMNLWAWNIGAAGEGALVRAESSSCAVGAGSLIQLLGSCCRCKKITTGVESLGKVPKASGQNFKLLRIHEGC